MRYPASEKAEIIQLVEQSHLPAKRTLDKLGIPRARAQAAASLRQWLILRGGRSGQVARGQRHRACTRGTLSSPNPGKDRALAPDPEEPHPARQLLPARRSRTADQRLRRAL